MNESVFWLDETLLLPRMSDDVSQGSALQELHHYPEFITDQITVIHVDHVLVMVVSHDDHLRTDEEMDIVNDLVWLQ